MKIAIIHNQYRLKGGIESYLFSLLNGFAVAGDTTFVTAFKVDSQAPQLPASTVKKIKLTFVPRVLREYVFAKKIASTLQRDAYDLTLSLTKTFNQDIIISGGTHLGFLRQMHKRLSVRDRITLYLEKKGFASSKKIIAHSQLIKDDLIDLYGVDPQKISLLHPPINTHVFNHQARDCREKTQDEFGLNRDKVTLLFPSTGHKRKGLDLLIAAMRQLPAAQYELVIVGSKPSHAYYADNIRYLGFVQDIAKLYAAVDFTILPSLYEPFGLVIVESLQCGTPVIVAKNVGASSLVTAAEGVVIEHLSPEIIARSITQAMHSQFNILPDFAVRHGLTIDKHIEKIKQLI